MLSASSVYFHLLWALKTPFVLLLDSQYKTISLEDAHRTYVNMMVDVKYVAEWHDCDDFAWIMKAVANTKHLNTIGFVIGSVPGGLHAWNVMLCDEGIYQLEPQIGAVFQKKKEYRPLLVII